MLTNPAASRIKEVMRLRTLVATVFMTAALSGLSPARMAAQSPAPARETTVLERVNAEETRQRFRDLLNDYPPSLREVLRLDPSLMTNQNYLAPYPALAAYISQHPEVTHNPAFFVGDPRFTVPEPQRRTIEAIQESLAGLAIFLFFTIALAVATHVGRSILEHRRWMHAMKIQTDTHVKLVDRLSSNDELMAYIQSPVGQRFLTSAPVSIEPERMGSLAAPLNRILLSIQIGVVAACGGTGLWIAKNRVIEEVAQPLHVIAILAIALGIGFVVSGILAYGLSEQMGLLNKKSSNA
jgi:hypothetical protein